MPRIHVHFILATIVTCTCSGCGLDLPFTDAPLRLKELTRMDDSDPAADEFLAASNFNATPPIKTADAGIVRPAPTIDLAMLFAPTVCDPIAIRVMLTNGPDARCSSEVPSGIRADQAP